MHLRELILADLDEMAAFARAVGPATKLPARRTGQRTRQARRQSDNEAGKERGVASAMSSISLDTGVFIDDNCGMHFETTPDGTYLVFGDASSTLCVGLSDRALTNLALLGVQAFLAVVEAKRCRLESLISRQDNKFDGK